MINTSTYSSKSVQQQNEDKADTSLKLKSIIKSKPSSNYVYEPIENIIKNNIVHLRSFFEMEIEHKLDVDRLMQATILEAIRLNHRFRGKLQRRNFLFFIARRLNNKYLNRI
ncbi:hypothetical protein [Agarilytica rhodophyticola]|uniref:hypothetical protein n=1 Tax=Agarilytica rhodophyticola TaxID=1737490 RepID=UPI000B3433C9|nr:hypothetical protein [Agarilytica rhodophyticola]